MKRNLLAAVFIGFLVTSTTANAVDEYEDGPGDNSGTTTTNELRLDQEHDLEATGGVAGGRQDFCV